MTKSEIKKEKEKLIYSFLRMRSCHHPAQAKLKLLSHNELTPKGFFPRPSDDISSTNDNIPTILR